MKFDPMNFPVHPQCRLHDAALSAGSPSSEQQQIGDKTSTLLMIWFQAMNFPRQNTVSMALAHGTLRTGGFFLISQDLGGNVQWIIPCLCCCFFTRRSTCTHKFYSLGQDQSTVAQWAKMTRWTFPELVSLISFQTMSWQHSRPIPTSLGQGSRHV